MSGRRRILVGTRNRGKLVELARMLELDPLAELVPLDAVPPVPTVIEDAETFEDNAAKKARETALATGLPTLADDSGLEVDALGGAPGVRSARYAGEHASDESNNGRLLRELASVPEGSRHARFRCVLAFADPGGLLGPRVHVEHGTCEGTISDRPRGELGFGYDPLFVPAGEEQTLAELGPAVKDRVSHRGAAAARMRVFLRDYLSRRSG